MLKSMLKRTRSSLLIAFSCVAYAFSFYWFIAASHVTCGGLTGVAQTLNALFPVLPVGATVLVLNVPLFLLAWRRFGSPYLARSLFAMAFSSLLIDLFARVLPAPEWDPMLACLYGGAGMGASIGLLMREETTTGGTEMGARLLKIPFPHLSIGRLCLVIDVAVIALYAAARGSLESALYGGVALSLCSAVMDLVVYGGREAKLAYIVSARQDEITRELLRRGMGVTRLTAQGAYTEKDRPVLLCAIRRREIAAVKRMVSALDPGAFVIVCDAREVLGMGFSAYNEL